MAACAGPFADMQLPQRCMLLSDAFGVHNSMPLPHAHLLTCLGIGDDATYGEQSLMRALSLPLDYSINIPDPSHHLLHSCLPPPLETSSPSRRAGSPSLLFTHRCTLYPDLSSDSSRCCRTLNTWRDTAPSWLRWDLTLRPWPCCRRRRSCSPTKVLRSSCE